MPLLRFLFLSLLLALPVLSFAKIAPEVYGYELDMDERIVNQQVARHIDSMLQSSFLLEKTTPVYGNPVARQAANKTLDFYLVVLLCLFLGVVRWVNPRYFSNLWNAYFQMNEAYRYHEGKMQHTVMANILMNIFFVFAFAMYLYYLIKSFYQHAAPDNRILWMAVLLAGIGCMYSFKYLINRFFGWLFQAQDVMDNYLYHVLLTNKLLAVILLPFIILLAFAESAWLPVTLTVSLLIAAVFFIVRYVKVWKTARKYFDNNKIHFFTYLCASEILPMVVLSKFLLHELVVFYV